MKTEYAAVLPIVLIGVGFVVYCLIDLFRTEQVRYLPRWLWAIICVVSVPIGGIAYLIPGKEH